VLKVIVTGAFSTGKTSLVDALSSDLVNRGLTVATLPDVARDCPVPLNADQTEDATLWLLATQIAREIEAALGAEMVMLCDRGVPDVLAHQFDLGSSGKAGWGDLLNPFLDSWLSTYDLILFSRVDERIPIASDGLRVEDSAYRTWLDQLADRVLFGRANVEELPSESTQRLGYAREAIVRSLSLPDFSSSIERT
jgi:nicotinamide riboside kinase